MEIQTLRNFLILSETLNFTKASEKSFIVQSALSKQIKQLEEEMAVTLFKRDKRNVQLTPAGRYFRQELMKTINQFDYALGRAQQLHKGEAGEIRIGYTHSAMQSFLPKLIYTLKQRYPDLKTILLEMTNTRQDSALKNREIDLSISPNPIISPEFESKILIEGNFAVVLPVNHPLDQSNFESVSQLSQEAFVLPPKTEGTLYVGVIESIFTDAGFSPKIIHETPYANTGIRLVQGRVGITIEPAYGLYGYSDIKIIELDNIDQKAKLTLLWLPEFELEFPEVLNLLKNYKFK